MKLQRKSRCALFVGDILKTLVGITREEVQQTSSLKFQNELEWRNVSLIPGRFPPEHSTWREMSYIRWRHKISRQIEWARKERLGTRLDKCPTADLPISYPESTGFLVRGWSPVETLGWWDFLSHKSWDSLLVRMLQFKTEVKCLKMAARRSVCGWSLHTIEDTWNFWTRSMVIYFVCLYVTKRFKPLIRGLVLMIYIACLCITKRFKRIIRGLDLVIFCSDYYWCVSPTVWKYVFEVNC